MISFFAMVLLACRWLQMKAFFFFFKTDNSHCCLQRVLQSNKNLSLWATIMHDMSTFKWLWLYRRYCSTTSSDDNFEVIFHSTVCRLNAVSVCWKREILEREKKRKFLQTLCLKKVIRKDRFYCGNSTPPISILKCWNIFSLF